MLGLSSYFDPAAISLTAPLGMSWPFVIALIVVVLLVIAGMFAGPHGTSGEQGCFAIIGGLVASGAVFGVAKVCGASTLAAAVIGGIVGFVIMIAAAAD